MIDAEEVGRSLGERTVRRHQRASPAICMVQSKFSGSMPSACRNFSSNAALWIASGSGPQRLKGIQVDMIEIEHIGGLAAGIDLDQADFATARIERRRGGALTRGPEFRRASGSLATMAALPVSRSSSSRAAIAAMAVSAAAASSAVGFVSISSPIDPPEAISSSTIGRAVAVDRPTRTALHAEVVKDFAGWIVVTAERM